jgi:hypothetical protein
MFLDNHAVIYGLVVLVCSCFYFVICVLDKCVVRVDYLLCPVLVVIFIPCNISIGIFDGFKLIILIIGKFRLDILTASQMFNGFYFSSKIIIFMRYCISFSVFTACEITFFIIKTKELTTDFTDDTDKNKKNRCNLRNLWLH